MSSVSIVMPILNVNQDVCSIVSEYISQSNRDDEIILSINANFEKNMAKLLDFFNGDYCFTALDSSLVQCASGARNTALNYASKDVVVFADDDDFPERNRISEIKRIFDREKFDIFFSAMKNSKLGGNSNSYWRIKSFSWARMSFKNQIFLPSSAISINVAHNVRFNESVRYGEDYLFWLDCLKKGFSKVVYSNSSLITYNYDPSKLEKKYKASRISLDVRIRWQFFFANRSLSSFALFLYGSVLIVTARLLPSSLVKLSHSILSPTIGRSKG